MKGGRDYGAMNFMAKGKEGGIRYKECNPTELQWPRQ